MTRTFLSPGWLWLLVAVVALLAVYVLLQLRRRAYAVRFANLELLGKLAPKRPGWRRHLAFAALLLALSSLTVGMAKPTKDTKVPRDRATVMMAIDVSLSMRAEDVTPNRLEAAQAAAKEFVSLLPPRINLGLVTFSGTASVAVAPTTDRASVLRAIDTLELAERTAIGEAIFSCLDAVKSFQSQLQGTDPAEGNAPARIVLMSDGSNTWGRSPEQAVGAAKQADIPVSTIAFGTDTGFIDLEGQRVVVPVDHDKLRQIADGTGGSYYAAASAEELSNVYRDLGSQIGYTTERREITTWFVGIGLLFAFAAAGVSLAWSNRLL
ncbi:MAG TPA: VWA domain-containing protein [Mycobacteriales bacterium]|nr:VWA domain-containing protein [Mycobacteriales bacterium]